ncbi:MAG: ornithine cyclodeaminase family protein [Vulcanimicrobiaceae bacterium]
MSSPLWITEAEVVATLDLNGAIGALEAGLRLEAAGDAKNMQKTVASWGDGDTLHAIGAVVPGRGVVGTKTWAHTEGGATPLLILYNAHDGSLLAIVEAFALGQLRTGAMSGIATKHLAAADARELAIIGTGKQSFAQVAAVAAVRPLERVCVFSPAADHRRAFANRLRETFSFEVIEAACVADAVANARIVTLATRATAPFLHATDLARGTHVNAVGAIVPARAEFAQDLFDRAAVVAVDSKDSVAKLSREFGERFGPPGAGGWQTVQPISAIVAAGSNRPADADLTLFKAMGMGISDLALGLEILDAARTHGLGRPLEAPRRAPIRFTPSNAPVTAR